MTFDITTTTPTPLACQRDDTITQEQKDAIQSAVESARSALDWCEWPCELEAAVCVALGSLDDLEQDLWGIDAEAPSPIDRLKTTINHCRDMVAADSTFELSSLIADLEQRLAVMESGR